MIFGLSHDLAPDVVYSSPYSGRTRQFGPSRSRLALSRWALMTRLRRAGCSSDEGSRGPVGPRPPVDSPAGLPCARRKSLNRAEATRHRRLDRHRRRGPSAAGRLDPPQLDRFRTTIDGYGVWFRAVAGLADPRPVRSGARRRSAGQVRAAGRPAALRGAVTRPSPVVHACGHQGCLFLGADWKSSTHPQGDASDPFRTLPALNAAETWRVKRGQTAHWVLAIPLGQAQSRAAK